VSAIDNHKFLRQEYELLMQKQTDPSIEWQDITDFRAEYFGKMEHRDSVRKGFLLLKDFMEAGWVKDPAESTGVVDSKFVEMKKEKQKLSDSRVEYYRIIRQEARKESFLDLVKDTICQNLEPIKLKSSEDMIAEYSPKDLLISVSDLHTGIVIDTFTNRFNETILSQRLSKYVDKIISIQETHNAENAYIVVGELVSGIIHDNLRLQNNLDLMEQFKYACELIAAMLVVLSEYFANIYVYTTPGNHSRIFPQKEKSLAKENIDLLAPFYLRARLQNIENVHICDNDIDPMISVFDIRGNKVVSVHGDKDNPENVVQNMTLFLRDKIDIVLLGHRHTNGFKTVNDTKILQAGCCSGDDSYANDMRKRNRPEQIVAVIDDNGIDCLYDVQID